ncbi:MAG: hypothetical protein MJE77_09975 [Proteobacteria bacterium]|nr:hypothetical protein [Pseudomonadota bacterium]
MDRKQRKAYVAKKAEDRIRIKRKIASLSKKRHAYIAKKRAKKSGQNTLDEAVLTTVTGHMKTRGYRFKK